MAKAKKIGVDPFDADVITNDQEDEVAKAKNRRNQSEDIEDEDEVEEEDEVEVEDESEDESDEDDTDDDDDDDDDDEDADPDEFALFQPFIVHEDQEWTLESVLAEATPGDTIYFYHLESNHFYKLEPVKVGEIPGA